MELVSRSKGRASSEPPSTPARCTSCTISHLHIVPLAEHDVQHQMVETDVYPSGGACVVCMAADAACGWSGQGCRGSGHMTCHSRASSPARFQTAMVGSPIASCSLCSASRSLAMYVEALQCRQHNSDQVACWGSRVLLGEAQEGGMAGCGGVRDAAHAEGSLWRLQAVAQVQRQHTRHADLLLQCSMSLSGV